MRQEATSERSRLTGELPGKGEGAIPAPHPFVLYGLIAVMVACWTGNFIVGKWGLRYLDPFSMASFRVILAAAILCPVYLARRRGRGAEGGRRAWPTRGDLWIFAQLGLFGVAMNQVLFTIGLFYTTAGHSSLIIGAGPILILLLGWTQGLESVTVKKVLGLAMAFIGVGVLASEHGISLSAGSFRGDVITFIGALAFAIYTILGKKVARRYDSVGLNFFSFLFGAVLILPLAIYQALKLDWGSVAWPGWVALAYMAGLASVSAYVIYYWSLRYLAASRVAAFGYLQPVLVTALGVLALGEQITVHLLVGGPLVLLGVYLTEVGPRENGTKNASRSDAEGRS